MATTARQHQPPEPSPAGRPPGALPDPPRGAASTPVADQRSRALAAWDAFRDIAVAIDPDAPSRLPGWTGRDVVVHLASWPEEPLLARLVDEARGTRSAAERPLDTDAANAALTAAHADATHADLLAALDDGRARLDAAYAAAADEGIGLAPTGSQVGPVPLLTQLGAIAYELAVHAADLVPCGAPPAPAELADAGLLALADTAGALAARHGLTARAALVVPSGGWSFTAAKDGWSIAPAHGSAPKTTPQNAPAAAGTAPNGPGPRYPAVRAASPAVLLDASAGRRAVPTLLLKRELKLDNIAGLLALAPLLDHVPGIPGGPALKIAVTWLGGVGRAVARLQG
ncbi:maleylpyruvate isomerase family mycothiol-dependent enzyme [Yinghuangia sp. ASG 101]|uniref:maleylpyruvate isomerase family mycothiol-dependent enzyme n=1 Tax=Yinghuangia sp. ASG 101 TaxID=2896848 RepID=UPI001E4CF885|nr:maleylpyruvate isomerase family mycothiol-dependent enzyme [Yinghuangia sp. ASG 101]UGQ14081.1 maleylpyruvate isomerase family mycothiol-dependent enzyme [Yinghuangia sp. ASG 101]